MLDKAMLQVNQRQWQEVAQIKLQEERSSSLLQRWQKLNALIRLAASLELPVTVGYQDEIIVWERWNKLRNLHLAEGSS